MSSRRSSSLLASLLRSAHPTRWQITSKQGNKNFYKGRGAPSAGRWTKKGRYLVLKEKTDRYKLRVPDMTDFELKAYVSRTTVPFVNASVPVIPTPWNTRYDSEQNRYVVTATEMDFSPGPIHHPLFRRKGKRATAEQQQQQDSTAAATEAKQ